VTELLKIKPDTLPAHRNGHGGVPLVQEPASEPKPTPSIEEQLRADAEAYESRDYTGPCPMIALWARPAMEIAAALQPDATPAEMQRAIFLIQQAQRADRE